MLNLSDEMSPYCDSSQKSVKWYKKIMFELILNISVAIARKMCKNFTNGKISSVEFRKQLPTQIIIL